MRLHAFGDLASMNRREYVDRAGLDPVIQGFGGSTLQERLGNGAIQAGRVLSKYVGSLAYSDVAAREMFNKVEAWQAANSYQFEAIMRSGADTVPEQVRLAFGDQAARQFVVASYSQAVKGIKAWDGGAIGAAVKVDSSMTQSVAQADAENRLIVFAQIILLDRDGTLQEIFSRSGASGFGELTVGAIALISVAVVGAIAGIVVLARSYMDLSYTDKWIEERCRINPSQCDDTLNRAIDNMFEGKSPGGGGADTTKEFVSSLTGPLGTALGIGLLAYIGVTFVLPAARDAMKEKTS